MGGLVSKPFAGFRGKPWDFFSRPPNPENPSLEDIEKLRQDLKAADEKLKDVQEELAQVLREEDARERKFQERLERERRTASNERQRMQQRFRRWERTAREMNRRLGEAREELEQMHEYAEWSKRQAREEIENLQRTAEQREREIREEWEQVQKAEEERRRAFQEELEQVRNAAREKEEEARKELERVQDDLRTGFEGEMVPTKEEVEAAKAGIDYRAENLHFAVCGTAGSGKSSLINAIRGIRNGMPGAARTGITETTSEIGRFPDYHSDGRSRFVWYDVPGAGTLNIPGWQHFNHQGLYVFDFIIVVIDNRVTKIDLEIIKNCRRFDIPSFIVRTKGDQHIRNLQDEMSYSDGGGWGVPENSERENEGKGGIRKSPYELARDKYVSDTRKSVTENLLQAELPDQSVYIVCKEAIYRLMESTDAAHTGSAQMVDEERLLRDLMTTALSRRYSCQTAPST